MEKFVRESPDEMKIDKGRRKNPGARRMSRQHLVSRELKKMMETL